MLISEKEFTKKINEKNNLRLVIKKKKITLSKLWNIPEALDECLSLQSEIKLLEKKLLNL